MNELRAGTLHLDDAEFIRAFESCELPNHCFHHADHVRLAWLYIHEAGPEQAEPRMIAAIRRFALHNGATQKFHHTMTCAWVRLIAAAVRNSAADLSFVQFVARNPHLLDAKMLERYYSPTLLQSSATREGWLPPDLNPLPELEKFD